ncbi:unnamed protein product [Staurois parvus]|uniref:Uncharacterized protein n=1 Tax=Staurois parvus TaxID=386267 RepID=A0ABN9G366_9NEOB|nr:unnamed protein product [Staurois parvus]
METNFSALYFLQPTLQKPPVGHQFSVTGRSGQGCQTAGPPAVAKLQVPSCLCLWESCL